jgi:hypothetical protein
MLPPWHASVYDKEKEDMMRHSKQFANFRLDNITELISATHVSEQHTHT